MRNFPRHIIVVLLLLINSGVIAQPIWYFTNTGNNHIVLIQNTIEISVDSQQISAGDYIGAFYDSVGTLACAGYIIWQNQSNTIAIWGSQPGIIDGLSTGEEIKWKIYKVSNQTEFSATATYNSVGFPNEGYYTTNGMSSLSSLIAYTPTQSPLPWYFTETLIQHRIIIPDTLSQPQNNGMVPGDYIGVFYDSSGTFACGGYIQWTGFTDTLIANGSEIFLNGFLNSEDFFWQIWRQSVLFSEPIIVDYDLINFIDSSKFTTNGLSKITGFNYSNGPDMDVLQLTWPLSGCDLNLSSFSPIIQILNSGDSIITDFYIDFQFNLTVDTTMFFEGFEIQPDSLYYLELPILLNITNPGSYSFSIVAVYGGDINLNNNNLNKIVNNYQSPEVTILLDSVICSNIQSSVTLIAIPTGGLFNGQNILGNQFYPVQPGYNTITYNYIQPNTGCTATASKIINVIQSPSVNLGNDIEACINDTIILTIPVGYQSYEWVGLPDTTNQIEVVASGEYSVIVTDSFNCSSDDKIFIHFNQLPEAIISGYSTACENDTITLYAIQGFDFYQWGTVPITYEEFINVSSTGYYNLTVTDNNCSASDSFYVNFLPLPVIEIIGPDSACAGEIIKLEATGGFPFYFWNTGVGISSSINVTQSGIYSVSVINSDNCTGSDYLHIEFFNYPEINLGNFPGLCEGDTAILYPGEADTYTWQDGSESDIYLATESGYYSVNATKNGCSSNDDTQLLFLSSPKPDFKYTVDFNEVKFINMSDIAENYMWQFGDDYSSEIFDPIHIYNTTGKYLVNLQTSNSCGEETFTDTVAINHLVENRLFQEPLIYPNPSDGIFTISFPLEDKMDFSLFVVDMGGCIIWKNDYELIRGEHLINIDISYCASGEYQLIWKFDNGALSKDLIIIHP